MLRLIRLILGRVTFENLYHNTQIITFKISVIFNMLTAYTVIYGPLPARER